MDKDSNSSSTENLSPLTNSSDSETFETWTVISEKSKEELEPLSPEKSEDDEDIAGDAVHVEVLKGPNLQMGPRYNDMDDLSDGISIISESESAGRMSPHPELRKRLSDLNMQFMNVTDKPAPSTTGRSSPLNYEACSERSSDTFHEVEPFLEGTRRSRRSSRHVVESTDPQHAMRCGLKGLFFVGALLATLSFVSKLQYDSWKSDFGTSTGLLTQRITELELKNNLMRAEIDILTKQVNHLTTLSGNQKRSQSKSKNNQPRENKIKVWSGNGNTIEKMEISPKDLKKPFNCEGQNSVDIAGTCIQLPVALENVDDSLENKMREAVNEKEYLSNLEKVVDRTPKLTENPFNEQIQNPTEATPTTETPSVPQKVNKRRRAHAREPDHFDKSINPEPDHFDKSINPDSHKKRSSKNGSGESKEKKKSRRDKSNEDNNGSGERHKKSKEQKKHDKRSSIEYENAKREADGQWHEKLMQNRENARKNNEKHRHDKNWYIERGDSREQARVTEQKYRTAGQL